MSIKSENPVPFAFYAGVWVSQWKSVRKVKEGETTNDLFAFLTAEPNREVGSIHPKAMHVILTKPEKRKTWLAADWATAGNLQTPLPDGSLKIVVRDGQ